MRSAHNFFCLGSCGGFRCLHHPSGALRGRLLKLVTRTCRQHNVHVMAVVSFADARVYAGCSGACASAASNWRSVAMLRCNASTTGSGKATAPGTSLAQEMNKTATALLECVTAQLNPDAGCADMQALLDPKNYAEPEKTPACLTVEEATDLVRNYLLDETNVCRTRIDGCKGITNVFHEHDFMR